MILRQWSAVVIALTATIGQAQSSPLGSAARDSIGPAGAARIVENVAYRLCARDGGVMRCRWVEIYNYRAPRVYGYQAPVVSNPPSANYGYPAAMVYGPPNVVYGYRAQTPNNPIVVYGAEPPIAYRYRTGSDYIDTTPDAYPVGTTPWWQNMDRQGSGGHPE